MGVRPDNESVLTAPRAIGSRENKNEADIVMTPSSCCPEVRRVCRLTFLTSGSRVLEEIPRHGGLTGKEAKRV